jgi:hypothetical protein
MAGGRSARWPGGHDQQRGDPGARVEVVGKGSRAAGRWPGGLGSPEDQQSESSGPVTRASVAGGVTAATGQPVDDPARAAATPAGTRERSSLGDQSDLDDGGSSAQGLRIEQAARDPTRPRTSAAADTERTQRVYTSSTRGRP